jgi:hypothetical protein
MMSLEKLTSEQAAVGCLEEKLVRLPPSPVTLFRHICAMERRDLWFIESVRTYDNVHLGREGLPYVPARVVMRSSDPDCLRSRWTIDLPLLITSDSNPFPHVPGDCFAC